MLPALSRVPALLAAVVLAWGGIAPGVMAQDPQPPAAATPAPATPAAADATPAASDTPTPPESGQPPATGSGSGAAPGSHAVAPAPASPTPAEDPILATVNGAPIRRSEVRTMIATLPPQLRQMPEEVLLPIVAEQMAIGRLVRNQGVAAGLQGDPEVQRRLAEAQDRIIQEVWLDRAVRARITDDMLNEAYQRYLQEHPVAEEVHARHILVPTQEEAAQIITQLNAGASFDDMVREHGTATAGSTGNRQGGDLGWFQRQDMVPAFAEAAFALQPGEFTQQPVQTQFGWHVIIVDDRRTPAPPTRDEVRDELERGLRQSVAQQIIGELRQSAEIRVFGPDGEPVEH